MHGSHEELRLFRGQLWHLHFPFLRHRVKRTTGLPVAQEDEQEDEEDEGVEGAEEVQREAPKRGRAQHDEGLVSEVSQPGNQPISLTDKFSYNQTLKGLKMYEWFISKQHVLGTYHGIRDFQINSGVYSHPLS